MRNVCCAMLALPAALAGGTLAAAADFPTRPIRYIAASAPGGASDIIARAIAPPLSEALGVQVVIDNRPGAGNIVGAELAARAAPDGHTLFGCNIASLAVSPALYKKPGYDPERDFAPIGLIASNPNVLTVNPALAAATVAQFVTLAKAQPGKLNYASAGVGTSPQLSMELFRMETGISIVHVPYKGVPPAMVDLIAGRVEAMFSTVPSVLAALRRNNVRALGVTSLQRDPDLPQVPTIAESGLPKFEVISWQGLCAPAGVPPATLARINTVLTAVLALPDTRKLLLSQGFQLNILAAEPFAAYARAERQKWAKVIKDIGIAPQ
jgi:tripartite-type tricarboxylate transporter receptor subunit TctC